MNELTEDEIKQFSTLLLRILGENTVGYSFDRAIMRCKTKKDVMLTLMNNNYKLYTTLDGKDFEDLKNEIEELEEKNDQLEWDLEEANDKNSELKSDIENITCEMYDFLFGRIRTLNDEMKIETFMEHENKYLPWELEQLMKDGKRFLSAENEALKIHPIKHGA